MFNDRNIPLSTDYRGRCGNCHELFDNDEEKYCKYCGTKRGEGEFKPYDNQIYCIYGPMPEKRTRECVKCGNQWTYINKIIIANISLNKFISPFYVKAGIYIAIAQNTTYINSRSTEKIGISNFSFIMRS